jgi:choline/carnitine/betaine transport
MPPEPTSAEYNGQPYHTGQPGSVGKAEAATEPLRSGWRLTDWAVFGIAAVIACGIVGWGVGRPGSLARVATTVLQWLVNNLGWLFVLAATGFVVFVLWAALSRYGRIPLGRDGEQPEFRTVSWVAMMFSAGMGIGLMFYGVSEPLTHFVEPPPGAEPGLGTAMATTLFHWTIHPWAMYAVMGLALAYGTYRRGRPQLISAAFWPLLGKATAGPAGKAIDIMAIFATLFGSAASLGLGALQIGAGFEANGWLYSPGNALLVTIIVVLTVAFIASAVSGVAKGIQWLSNTNMVLAVVLAVFVFVVGPTVLILNVVPTAVGDYFRDLASMSARTAAAGGDATNEWLSSWTIFYWAWWISWTPFVGMFIARISRGRTIRQFVAGVIAVPSVVSLVWFAIFGGAAINAQRGGTDIAGQGGVEAQLFGLLHTFPLAGVASVLVMVLVAIFFVSGADAASMVLGTLSQRGNQDPQRWNVIFWGAATGAVAIVMLLVGGVTALSGLQTLTIIAAAPFILLMIGLCASLARDLRTDPMIVADHAIERQLREQHHNGSHGSAESRKAVSSAVDRPISGE